VSVEVLQQQGSESKSGAYVLPYLRYLEAIVIAMRGCYGCDDRHCGVMVPSRKLDLSWRNLAHGGVAAVRNGLWARWIHSLITVFTDHGLLIKVSRHSN
jgi:hypothetical protein